MALFHINGGCTLCRMLGKIFVVPCILLFDHWAQCSDVCFYSQVPSIVDTAQEMLQRLDTSGSDGITPEQLKDFKKRKLINNMSVSSC